MPQGQHTRIDAVDAFFSYSHKDEVLREQLEVHLAPLKREDAIRTWHDREILAGEDWDGEIDKHLERADLILLLISPDFLASDFCFDREMTRAMKRHRTGEARVIPIILRPCDWQRAPFGQLQALPKDGKPVTSWPDRDQAFLDVEQGIRRAIAKVVKPPDRENPTAPRIFMVPYQRNPYFTGREDVLDALHEALRSGGSAALSQAEPAAALPQGTRTAISGLGGIGKTQTAVE
ncbi:MAG: toll/interleukin-1 receptor domain-containing protein [bacterium]|nr:toll/interleukin-1 receptor domain-containing protein [bacterium]